MASGYATILTDISDGVLTVTLNRPDSLNAYNAQMGVEIGTALRIAQRDDGIRCIVLTGAGRAFCSGQDLAEIRGHYAQERVTLDFGAHLRKHFNPLITRLRTIEKPVIAAINGVAAGAGASFAFASDLCFAAKSAKFVLAFANIGLIPDSGATLTLLQHVGYRRAAELCFLGDKLSADEAVSYGLVNRVVDDSELAAYVAEQAKKLAAMPTRALGLTKRALLHAWSATLEDQLEYEAFLQATAGATKDHAEGVLAFLEKRTPKFGGS